MPSDEENVKFLYLVLTHDGVPNIDWPSVTQELGLSKGAVSKRWSRLNLAMKKSEDVNVASANQLLWLCMKHAKMEKTPDWTAIAPKLNTTAGAASKRYSRMKLAFENGTATMPTADATTGKGTRKAKDVGDGEVKVKGEVGNKRKREVKSKSGDKEEAAVAKKEDEPEREAETPKAKPKSKRARVIKKEDDESQTADDWKKPSGGATRAKPVKKAAAKGPKGTLKNDIKLEDNEDIKLPSAELMAELEALVKNAQAGTDGGEESNEFFDAETGEKSANDLLVNEDTVVGSADGKTAEEQVW